MLLPDLEGWETPPKPDMPELPLTAEWWRVFTGFMAWGANGPDAVAEANVAAKVRVYWGEPDSPQKEALQALRRQYWVLDDGIKTAMRFGRMRRRMQIETGVGKDYQYALKVAERLDPEFKPKQDLTSDDKPIKAYMVFDPEKDV